MKDKWLDEIRNKVDGMEMEEPAGLWDAIEMNSSTLKSKRRKPFLAIRLFTAAASVATVFGLAYLFLSNRGDKIDMSVSDIPFTAMNVNHSEKPTAADKTEFITKTSTSNLQIDGTTLAKTSDISQAESISTDKLRQVPNGESAADQTDKIENNTSEELRISSETEGKHPDSVDNGENSNRMGSKTRKKNRNGNFSVGVFTAGNFNSSTNNNTAMGRFAISDQLYDSDDETKSQVVRSRAMNKTDNRKISAKYHQPLRFGLTIRYNFTPHIGLESGVMYSKLRSDFKEGDGDSYFSGEQTLHYIGIPLNLSYRILSWKKFDIYSSVGVMGEKCVSGRLKGHKVENSNIGEQKSSHLHESGFQFSANASAGIQFRVNNTFGIYAEPGVSYYFDNGSNLQTIYKDRKTNFNLNLGLRFNFGTK